MGMALPGRMDEEVHLSFRPVPGENTVSVEEINVASYLQNLSEVHSSNKSALVQAMCPPSPYEVQL